MKLIHLSAAVLLALGACGQSALRRHQTTAAQVLQRTGVPDFVDASTEERAAIVHAPSGLVCILPRDGDFNVSVFPASAVNRGAQCSTANGATATVFVVVRFAADTSIDQVFAEALSSTAGQAEGQPWAGRPSASDLASPEGLPHFRIARFELRIGDAPSYLRVAVGEARGWYLQQVVTAPLAEAETVEAEAGIVWREALAAFGAQR